MKRVQAFKFELRPDGAQRRQMRCFAGSCRFVYNKALALQKARFDAGEKKFNYAGLCKLLTGWRSQTETLWLKDVPTHPLQQVLKDLERAYSNFFARRADLPRFKKKGRHESFRYPDPKQIKLEQANSRLFLPKLGWLRYRNSRTVLGAVKNVTVSVSCCKWFVSIQTEREVEQPLPRGGAVGIDLGEVGFSVAVSGMTIPPADLRSSASRRTTTRSCNGRMFTTPSISLKIKSFVPGLGTRHA
jgi:putative transposase